MGLVGTWHFGKNTLLSTTNKNAKAMVLGVPYSVVDHLLASAVKALVRLLILEVVVLNLGRNRCILAMSG